MDVHAFAVVVMAFCLIRIGGKGGKARNQFDALTQIVRCASVFRIFIVGIRSKHAARKLIHNIARRGFHNHVFGKGIGQRTVCSQKQTEFVQFLALGQFAEQQKVYGLFKSELVAAFGVFDQIFNIVTAVNQLSGNGGLFSVNHFVADNIADTGKADKHAAPVRIAQSALYVVFLIQILIDKAAGLGQIGKPPEKSLFENIHHVHPRRETIILKNNRFCKDT